MQTGTIEIIFPRLAATAEEAEALRHVIRIRTEMQIKAARQQQAVSDLLFVLPEYQKQSRLADSLVSLVIQTHQGRGGVGLPEMPESWAAEEEAAVAARLGFELPR